MSGLSLLLSCLVGQVVLESPQEVPTPTVEGVERAHQLFRGTWEVVGVIEDGETLGSGLIRDRLARDGRIQFVDRNLVIVDPRTGDSRTTPFRLNPAATPRRIDLTSRDDRVLPGIYRFEGDELTICLSIHPDTPRPTEFEAPAGSDRLLAHLRMVPSAENGPSDAKEAPTVPRTEARLVKDTAKRTRPAEAKDDPADVPPPPERTPAPEPTFAPSRKPTESEIRRAHEMLIGNWDILSIVDDGETLGPELIRTRVAEDSRVRFTQHTVTMTSPVTDADKTVSFRVNPAAVPSEIDIITTFDSVLKGIYAFDGDVLQICVAKHSDGPRPTEFTSTAGSDRLLYRLKVASPDPQPAPPPPPPSAAEIARQREATIRQMIAGRWTLADANGTMNVAFHPDGAFYATRTWSRQARGLFGPKSDDSQGQWSFASSRLNAQVTRTTDKQIVGQLFSFRVISISDNTMVVADNLGTTRTLRKFR